MRLRQRSDRLVGAPSAYLGNANSDGRHEHIRVPVLFVRSAQGIAYRADRRTKDAMSRRGNKFDEVLEWGSGLPWDALRSTRYLTDG